ncbi:hypothetical protein Bbelb_236420 [Branchiostoma belcheri]|nr:hypothetical protein Bbelb_236420 [Branchiostoma belcheri]
MALQSAVIARVLPLNFPLLNPRGGRHLEWALSTIEAGGGKGNGRAADSRRVGRSSSAVIGDSPNVNTGNSEEGDRRQAGRRFRKGFPNGSLVLSRLSSPAVQVRHTSIRGDAVTAAGTSLSGIALCSASTGITSLYQASGGGWTAADRGGFMRTDGGEVMRSGGGAIWAADSR